MPKPSYADLLRALTQLCFMVRTGDKAARMKACEGAEKVISNCMGSAR